MKYRACKIDIVNGVANSEVCGLGDVRVGDTAAIMSIDCSASLTGISIISIASNMPLYSIVFGREKSEESFVEYKVTLKKLIKGLLDNNAVIEYVFYEEPYIGYATALAPLYSLKTSVPEIIAEYPMMQYLQYREINNMWWKKEFLKPNKIPQGTENQKRAIRDALVSVLGCYNNLSQDECDAYGMGWVCCNMLKGEIEEPRKTSRSKFKYNIEFVSANVLEHCIEDATELDNVPMRVKENGVRLVELTRHDRFERTVFNTMGDDDVLVLIIFNKRTGGEVILKYQLSYLSDDDYICAIVWRVSRKYG